MLTGEAAVTIGATGQGMVAGDLVNTACRLQSVAPPGTVLVGESHLSARRARDRVRGGRRAGPERQDSAGAGVASAARRGQARRRGSSEALEAPFVGRDDELRLLKDFFHATARERRARLVSVTGQAGIGKSRLAGSS